MCFVDKFFVRTFQRGTELNERLVCSIDSMYKNRNNLLAYLFIQWMLHAILSIQRDWLRSTLFWKWKNDEIQMNNLLVFCSMLAVWKLTAVETRRRYQNQVVCCCCRNKSNFLYATILRRTFFFVFDVMRVCGINGEAASTTLKTFLNWICFYWSFLAWLAWVMAAVHKWIGIFSSFVWHVCVHVIKIRILNRCYAFPVRKWRANDIRRRGGVYSTEVNLGFMNNSDEVQNFHIDAQAATWHTLQLNLWYSIATTKSSGWL